MDKKEKRKEINRKASLKYYHKNKDKVKAYRDKNKDKINESSRNHYIKNKDRKHELGKIWRSNNRDKESIIRWKSYGIITTDWDNVYDVYINTTNCDYCNKKFKDSKDRQLDHDHSITDNNNIRGILCRVCNTTDVLKGYPTIFRQQQ